MGVNLPSKNETFVTIFDFNFLPQGLLLHASLLKHFSDFTLWICCLDEKVYDFLDKAQLNNVKIFRVSDLESSELLKVKEMRTAGEYAWTVTPFLPSYLFAKDLSINRVTYLDADLWFLKNPNIILDYFSRSNKSILLTPHDFESSKDLSHDVGKYCVQFLTVNRSAQPFLEWWQKLCVDWCYSRIEQDRFGDQKYLDLVPSLFPNLYYELKKTNLTQGPWNVNKFNPEDAVFFHFHGLRIKGNLLFVQSGERIKRSVYNTFYKPYIRKIREEIKSNGFSNEFIQTHTLLSLKDVRGLKQFLGYLLFTHLIQKQKIYKL